MNKEQLWNEFLKLLEPVEKTAEQAGSQMAEPTPVQTIVIGLVVVVGTLMVLTGIFYLFGFIMTAINKPKKPKQAKKAEEAPAAPAPVAKATPAPVVQSGISDEVVAAIAAAVAMMAPEGKRYAVKSVSRANGNGRSAWAAAGVADNTRPF